MIRLLDMLQLAMAWCTCQYKGHVPKELGPYYLYQDQSETYYIVCARCELTLSQRFV